jgi:hypothetical protein
MNAPAARKSPAATALSVRVFLTSSPFALPGSFTHCLQRLQGQFARWLPNLQLGQNTSLNTFSLILQLHNLDLDTDLGVDGQSARDSISQTSAQIRLPAPPAYSALAGGRGLSSFVISLGDAP